MPLLDAMRGVMRDVLWCRLACAAKRYNELRACVNPNVG
jgi:hypothetical protein